MKIIKKGNVYRRASKFKEYEFEIFSVLSVIELVLVIILGLVIRG